MRGFLSGCRSMGGSSVADVRYRIGVDIFSCGLYGGNNGQA